MCGAEEKAVTCFLAAHWFLEPKVFTFKRGEQGEVLGDGRDLARTEIRTYYTIYTLTVSKVISRENRIFWNILLNNIFNKLKVTEIF